jgi:DNA-binding transcriptional MerR regulator
MADFIETTTSLARTAGLAPETVRRYADMGLIEFRIASDGTRLFRAAIADRVREIYANRIANRGRRSVR